MSENRPLEEMSLEELVRLAERRDLVDGWTFQGESVQLSVGEERISLRADSASAFVRGLIRGYEQARLMTDL
jgi:hypothetical protein